MADLLARLKKRKLVQWALAYLAAAWVTLQILDLVQDNYHWPDGVMHVAFGVLAIGFVVTLLLAWYHGDRGEQRVSGVELLIIALVLAVGGGALWHFSNEPGKVGAAATVVASNKPQPPAAPARSATASMKSAFAVQSIPAKSVAVLPFENLSRDPDNEYFVAGMQDLILTRLAGIGELKVISRTSTEQYASHPENLKRIAQELGVAHIVEGSVQKVGNDVLISVQLIDARTDHHLWAESYQRTLINIFGVEGEVATKVAAALKANLTAPEASTVTRLSTTNPRAYDDYLRGLNFDRLASKGDWTGNVPQAIAAFKSAIAADPDFALAWAMLSIERAVARFWGVDHSEANLQAAEREAKRALALAPRLPEAHMAMGHVQRFLYQDLAASRKEFQMAVDLRPNDAEALASLAITDLNLGNTDAAIKGFRHAIALDPQDSGHHFQLGLALTASGDFAAARQAQQRALVIDPQNVQAYLALSHLALRNGDVAAAARVLEQMAPGTPVNEALAITRIDLLVVQRRFAEARVMAEEYAGTFITGPATIDLAFMRAHIEWLAGKTRAAHTLYRAAIGLMQRAGHDIGPGGRMRLGVAYARLGDEKSAMQALAKATADKRMSDANGSAGYLWSLALVQLALEKKSAAIESLGKLAALRGDDGKPIFWVSTRLRIDPACDPLRDDPRFQALLKPYAEEKPAFTRPATGASH